MSDYLIERAIELLQDDKLLADAREGARVNNSAVGCLLSLEYGASRWAAERAVRAALRRLDKEANHD
jgi:hypothetical protein